MSASRNSDLVSAGRRMFLYRAGGAGLGMAAGEGAFQGASLLAAGSLRATERAVTELYLDFSMISGELEGKIAAERKGLESAYEDHLQQLNELQLPDLLDPVAVQELIDSLEFIEQKYTFAERLLQLRDRLDVRLIEIDAALEDLQPDVLQRLGDAIRVLHGKPTGEEYRLLRKQLREDIGLLTRAYASAEDTRRIELALSKDIVSRLKELNRLLDDPELAEMAQEFRQMLSERPEMDTGAAAIDGEELAELPAVDSGELQRLKQAVSVVLEKTRRLRTILTESQQVQQILAEGELLIQKLRERRNTEAGSDGHGEALRQRTRELERRVKAALQRLEGHGIAVETRREFVEHDTVSTTVGSALGSLISTPFRWTAWALAGGIGYLVGARISKARAKRGKGERK